MTSYYEALEMILQSIRVMDVEENSVFKSVGQVLAEDIFADFNLPQSDSSGPDGYAVRSADVKDAGKDTPVTLRIIETVRAGHLPKKTVKTGTAMRIMTGAVMPEGADSVVRFEDTDEPSNKNGPNTNNPAEVKIYLSVLAGANVLKAGNNIAKASLVLSRGQVIGPAQVSVLTSAGRSSIRVIRRPVVAVLSSGDELISSGKPLMPAKAYDCNGPAVAALVEHYGGAAQLLGIARDNEESILSRIKKGLEADAVIMSGGVSKGDYDLTRLALAKLGEVKFARISMGPGAAVAFAMARRQSEDGKTASVPVFALAGPPSGCLVNFETLVRPALFKMQGHAVTQHPIVEAIAQDAAPGKRKMAFVRWTNLEKVNGECRVKLNDVGMALANSLTIVPEEVEVQPGDKIQVLPLDWRRGPRACP